MSLRTWQELVRRCAFREGEYKVSVHPAGGEARALVLLRFDRDDAEGIRHLPEVSIPSGLGPFDKSLLCSALVRAGVRHPGLLDEDLRDLHRAARAEHHIELFADLNALNTGLLVQLVNSLGSAVARVVLSSSSIDVLHEYQGRLDKNDVRGGDFLRRAEMSRSLRMLDELRRTVPVHIHQLPPGASRYFARGAAGPVRRQTDPRREESDIPPPNDELTFISEDRQMIAAFWDYVMTTNPRLPLRLVTSDFSLAHVCVAERVPFLFARSPYEVWRDLGEGRAEHQGSGSTRPSGDQANENAVQPVAPEVLWFDPFAPALRCCTAQAILWELCIVFGRLDVISTGTGFRMSYVRRDHLPGRREEIRIEDILSDTQEPAIGAGKSAEVPRGQKQRTRAVKRTAVGEGAEPSLQIKLAEFLELLPTASGTRTPWEGLPLSEKQAGQIRDIGDATGLLRCDDRFIEAGPSLPELVRCLEKRAYIAINDIFRRVPAYDRVLKEASSSGVFPRSRVGGTAPGWAVILGAAYKTKDGVRYGLATVSEDEFARAVLHAHAELGQGSRAVPLPAILDKVCNQLRLSPVRFEGMLEAALGRGLLSGYEAQRATIDLDLPRHKVIVSPAVAEIGHFLREMAPGQGIVLGGTLVSSLVQRGED